MSSSTVGFGCFLKALSKPAAKVKSKSPLRERLQETPESHSKYSIISPGLTEKLRSLEQKIDLQSARVKKKVLEVCGTDREEVITAGKQPETSKTTKGLRKNNFTFSHPCFRQSLVASQSQNPQNSITVSVVLLNQHSQI
jgi:hypothetical protein